MGSEGVDNELDYMKHCGKAPTTWLETEIIPNKSEFGNHHSLVSVQRAWGTWILVWLLQNASVRCPEVAWKASKAVCAAEISRQSVECVPRIHLAFYSYI